MTGASLVAGVQGHGVSLAGQDDRGHEPEAVGRSGNEYPSHDGSFLSAFSLRGPVAASGKLSQGGVLGSRYARRCWRVACINSRACPARSPTSLPSRLTISPPTMTVSTSAG